MHIRFIAFLLPILLTVASPVAADTITVTLIGTGAGPGGGGRGMVGQRNNAITLVAAGGLLLVFDAGRGLVAGLARAGYGVVRRADKVFLTHLHSDHVTGLPDLFISGSHLGRSGPLHLWGPPGTEAMAAHFSKAFAWDIKYRINRRRNLPSFDARDVAPGRIFEEAGVTVMALAVDHWPPRLGENARGEFPAYGYRVGFAGRSVVLSGDTRFSKNVIKHAKGADLLIHEVSMITGKGRRSAHHTSPKQAGEVFRRAAPKLAVFSHIVFGRRNAKTLIRLTGYDGRLVVGEDGMRIEVGEEVKVIPQ
ncbi:MAG: MBL fold metallo-hydrolase [Pseudomonadota bacterium]|nr:MBL fold metallo-hydrolase [Pseudomonadota bacterium]